MLTRRTECFHDIAPTSAASGRGDHSFEIEPKQILIPKGVMRVDVCGLDDDRGSACVGLHLDADQCGIMQDRPKTHDVRIRR